MSELEEPPAKVLKIDNIDGVTHVTELSGFSEPFDGVVEEEILGEESGIIEGGAEPEQEEWLSEGILTDDDYNPASQETIDDQTDSQLGTGDEEHLDSTLDSEANMADGETNMADSEANIADSEANLLDSEANIENEGNVAGNDTNVTDYQETVMQNEANMAENEENVTNIAVNEAIMAQDDTNVTYSEVADMNGANVDTTLDHSKETMDGHEEHLAEHEEHLAEHEEHLVEHEEHLAGHEEHLAEHEEHLDESEGNITASDLQSENLNNSMEINANISLENGIHTMANESDITMNETNVTQNNTYMSLTEENVTHAEEMDMSNINDSQTYTQEYAHIDNLNSKLDNGSDIVIQRVITLNKSPNVTSIEARTGLNIEETMKHLDGEKDDGKDDFEKFLNKNTVTKTSQKAKPDSKEDDGNDTDDLLRMLGEDDSKGKKKLTKTVKDIREAAAGSSDDDDDDNFIYEGSSTNLRNLKIAKSVISKKKATKAVQEDIDDGDDETENSADESKTVQRMFGYSKSLLLQRNTKPTQITTKKPLAHVLNIVESPKNVKSTRQYQNKRLQSSQSLLKPTTAPTRPSAATKTPHDAKSVFKPMDIKSPAPFKPSVQLKVLEKKRENKYEPTKIEPSKIKTEPNNVKYEPAKMKYEPNKMKYEPAKMKYEPNKMKYEPAKKYNASKMQYEASKMKYEVGKVKKEPGQMKVEPEDPMDEEEFLDDDEFGLDEDEFAESEIDTTHHRQRIVRPETMDEEVPSDGESASEDGSLYDELPSSDSEDMDDWFTLDIRSEKAGEYIPLLGPRAKELLLEEKRRVSKRLTSLKQSHTALIASAKQQAGQLRRATAALAELDDMLRAA